VLREEGYFCVAFEGAHLAIRIQGGNQDRQEVGEAEIYGASVDNLKSSPPPITTEIDAHLQNRSLPHRLDHSFIQNAPLFMLADHMANLFVAELLSSSMSIR
jgi:hypothetical protein